MLGELTGKDCARPQAKDSGALFEAVGEEVEMALMLDEGWIEEPRVADDREVRDRPEARSFQSVKLHRP